MQLQAKEHQRLPVSNTNQKEAGSIYAFRGRMDMLSPLFQIFGLPHCDRINLCCFQPLNLWKFVTAALEN